MTHAMLAGITKSPRWALDQAECNTVATAAGKVLAHYDVPGVDEKTADWIGFIYALGLVYGTRMFAAMSEKPKAAPMPKDETRNAQEPVKPTEMPKRSADLMHAVDIPGVGKFTVPLQ
jgi:hypothetical protein